MNSDTSARLALGKSRLDLLFSSLGTLLGGAGVRREWALWGYLRARSYVRQSAAVLGARLRESQQGGSRQVSEDGAGDADFHLFESALAGFRGVRAFEESLDLLAPSWTAKSLAAQVRERRPSLRLALLEDRVNEVQENPDSLGDELAIGEAIRLRVECRAVCVEMEHALGAQGVRPIQEALAPLTSEVRGLDAAIVRLMNYDAIREEVAALEDRYYSIPDEIALDSVPDRRSSAVEALGFGRPLLTRSMLPWGGNAAGSEWWL